MAVRYNGYINVKYSTKISFKNTGAYISTYYVQTIESLALSYICVFWDKLYRSLCK